MGDQLATYDEEQAKLKAELDGTQDIHITVPRDPEVNPEVYRDVESVLYRGFLTVAAEIHSIHFVFKSLNHHELELLRFSGAFQNMSESFWSLFLAYGVFMVDGVNVLPARDKEIPAIVKVFREMPPEARSRIVRAVSEVNRRAANAVPLTEAYAMEMASRYRWLQLKGLDLTSTAVTGIDGTQRLGLNWAQQLWRALNNVEDRNEEHEREWENSKFIGSCFAGKGVSKLYNQDTERRRKEREERSSRKDRILREIVLGERPKDNYTRIPGAIIMQPKTVDELADQLKKDLKGEKDWHDRVIDEHEALIRDRYSARKMQMEMAAKESAVKFGDHHVVGTSSIEGLTQAEVDERLARKKQLQAQAIARMQVHPDIQDEKTETFLNKWNMVDGVSSEITTTDRDPSGAITLPATTRPQTPPFRRK